MIEIITGFADLTVDGYNDAETAVFIVNDKWLQDKKVKCMQYPVPSTHNSVPNTQYPVPSTQYPVPSTQYSVPSTFGYLFTQVQI